MPPKVWIDGAPVDAAQARVPVYDRGFLYGDSVYEVLRTFDGKMFELEPHLDRMEHSAAELQMKLPARDAIKRAIEDTLRAAGEKNAYIRIMVTRGAGEIALDPAAADGPRLIVIVKEVTPPPASAYQEGVEVAIVGRSRSSPAAPGQTVDPSVKSGNYLVSVLAVAEARRRGAYEAILCDGVGRITEGGSSNFFIVSGGRVRTPPLSAGLLEGITRRAVMQLCRGAGVAVDEVPLWPADMKQADEAFITSSVRGIVPVSRVDGEAIGTGRPGPVTQKVMALYDKKTRGG